METFIILAVCVLLLVCLCLCLYFKSSRFKGKMGEWTVLRKLGKDIPNKKHVINDLIIPTESNSSTQIDHVVINEFGVWVIETKNYSGRICGTANQQYWTQVLAKGKVKNQFYSPIKQNASHIYHLSKILKTEVPFHNVVLFTKNADISYVNADNVYYAKDIAKIINNGSQILLSPETIEQCYKKLISVKENNSITQKDHVRNLRKAKKAIKAGTCPRCGGKLIIRSGPYSDFYGCSKYPKCTFTKNLDD